MGLRGDQGGLDRLGLGKWTPDQSLVLSTEPPNEWSFLQKQGVGKTKVLVFEVRD